MRRRWPPTAGQLTYKPDNPQNLFNVAFDLRQLGRGDEGGVGC